MWRKLVSRNPISVAWLFIMSFHSLGWGQGENIVLSENAQWIISCACICHHTSEAILSHQSWAEETCEHSKHYHNEPIINVPTKNWLKTQNLACNWWNIVFWKSMHSSYLFVCPEWWEMKSCVGSKFNVLCSNERF